MAKKLAVRKAPLKKASAKKKPLAKKAKTKAKSSSQSKSILRSSSQSVKGVKRSQAKTKAESIPASVSHLQVGDVLPEFSAVNENGELIHSKALLGKKLVLYFYPKDNTPGCTQESCDFRDHFGRVTTHGAQVFGISRDSAQSHVKFKEKFKLPFSLLADEDGKLCETFGVWKEKNLYGRKYMGIERSTFLVDENGRIFKIYSKVKVK